MQVHLYSGQTLGLFWWIVYCIGELDRNSVILKQKFFLKKTRLIGKTKRQKQKNLFTSHKFPDCNASWFEIK